MYYSLIIMLDEILAVLLYDVYFSYKSRFVDVRSVQYLSYNYDVTVFGSFAICKQSSLLDILTKLVNTLVL
jgi:hypothetical protein